jgi:hypothetical protein
VAFIPELAWAEVIRMADYQAYVIEPTGIRSAPRSFACDTDDDAIVWAQQLFADLPIELWCGARLVKKISPDSNQQPISHEIHQGRMVPKSAK